MDIDDLPSARVITRDSFAGDTFDTDQFLYQYHQYQTLGDLKSQLEHWNSVFSDELLNIVSEEYKSFSAACQRVASGEPKIADIKFALSQFDQHVLLLKQGMDDQVFEVELLLKEKRRLDKLESQLKTRLVIEKVLTSFEHMLHAPSSPALDWKQLVTSFKGVERLVFDDAENVFESQRPRISKAKTKIVSAIASSAMDKFDKLVLLQTMQR